VECLTIVVKPDRTYWSSRSRTGHTARPNNLVPAVLHRRRAAKKVGRKSRWLLYTIVVRKPKIEIRAETALIFLPQEDPRQFRIESIVTKMAVACPHSL
jgi:hypothetical protein